VIYPFFGPGMPPPDPGMPPAMPIAAIDPVAGVQLGEVNLAPGNYVLFAKLMVSADVISSSGQSSYQCQLYSPQFGVLDDSFATAAVADVRIPMSLSAPLLVTEPAAVRLFCGSNNSVPGQAMYWKFYALQVNNVSITIGVAGPPNYN
jgi:hypothetical protein